MNHTVMRVILSLLVLSVTIVVAFQDVKHVHYNSLGSYRHRSPVYMNTSPGELSNHRNDIEIIARKILVKGDVNGGYVRTCILNEAGRFRKLLGTMSPPDDSNTAEIYVEGTPRNVEGFIRWCKKGTKSIGLSQTLDVIEVLEEEPTGLYDGFYVKTIV